MVGRGVGEIWARCCTIPKWAHLGLDPQEVMPRIRNAILPQTSLTCAPLRRGGGGGGRGGRGQGEECSPNSNL
jgi:hypothetical protein